MVPRFDVQVQGVLFVFGMRYAQKQNTVLKILFEMLLYGLVNVADMNITASSNIAVNDVFGRRCGHDDKISGEMEGIMCMSYFFSVNQ
jgi:hypothetical protein